MASGTQVGAIYIDLDADTAKFKSAISDAEKKAKDFGKNTSSYFEQSAEASKKFGLALTALGAGVVAFGAKAVKNFKESALVYQKLQTLILNGKAGTMEQVKALNEQAKAEQRLGIFTDDLVTSAQAQLATFDLSADAIHDLIPSFLDMVAAEKGAGATTEDLKQSAQGLGKALLGQTDTLIKQGFVITKHQKYLLETGNEMTRVHTIAEILGNTYNGMNAALRKTLGPMELAKMNLDDFVKSAGEAISKAIDPLIKGFNNWVDSIGGPEGAFKLLNEKVAWLEKHGTILAGIIAGALAPSFFDLGQDIVKTAIKLGPWVTAGILLAVVVERLVKLHGGWQKTLKDLQPVLGDVTTYAKNFWHTLQDIGSKIKEFLEPALKSLWKTYTEQLLPVLQEFWQHHGAEVKKVLEVLGKFIGGVLLVAIWGAIKLFELWIKAYAKIVSAADKYLTVMKKVSDAITGGVNTASAVVGKTVAQDIPNAFGQANDKITSVSKEVGNTTVSLGQRIGKVFSEDIPHALDVMWSKWDYFRTHLPEIIGKTLADVAFDIYTFFNGDTDNSFGKIVDDFTLTIQTNLETFWKWWDDGWKHHLEQLSNWLTGAKTDAVSTTGSMNAGMEQSHTTTWQNIKKTVKDGIDQIKDYWRSGGIQAAAKGAWDAIWQGAVQVSKNVDDTIGKMADSIVSFIWSIPGRLDGAFHNFVDWIVGLAKRMVIAFKAEITRRFGGSVGVGEGSYAGSKVFEAPARAEGGPVSAGMPYWVGERKVPELFVPKTDGNIVPMEKLGSSYSVVNNVQLNTPAAVEAFEERMTKKSIAANFGVGIA